MAENVLYCAGCNVRYRAKAYDATKAYKCPKCGGPIQVQGPSAETGDGVSLDTKGAPRDTQEKDPLVGTRIGQYKITKKLGQGGMGAVYLAAHLELGRNVALKILPQKMVKDSFLYFMQRLAVLMAAFYKVDRLLKPCH